MLHTILLIIVSFFAVIGFLECILNVLESISTTGGDQPDRVCLSVALSGEIENVSFLLNTLLLQAERITYSNCITEVAIVNNGMDENTYVRVKEFCDINDHIYIENQ